MMLKVSLLFTYSILASTYASADNIDENNRAQYLTTIIDAKPIERVAPKYPIQAARSGHEGWVKVSFIVEADGTTSNPIVEESSGGRGFEKSALRAIKDWQYSPATENGQTVQQCRNSVQLNFKMEGVEANHVSKRFLRLYKKAEKSLKAKQFDDVDEILADVTKRPLVTHGENIYLNYLKLDYAQKIGDVKLELDTLNELLSFNDFYNYKKKLKNKGRKGFKRDLKQEKVYSSILGRKLVNELKQNKISEALSSVNQLLLLKHNDEDLVRYRQQKQKINDFINSEMPLITEVNIKNKDFWRYRLVRQNFSFDQINGQLHKLDIRCNNKRHVYTINDQSTWKIPKSWQKCQLFVYGDNNTTFKLIEHGDQKATADQVGH